MVVVIQKFKEGDECLRSVLEGMITEFNSLGNFEMQIDALEYMGLFFLERPPDSSRQTEARPEK